MGAEAVALRRELAATYRAGQLPQLETAIRGQAGRLSELLAAAADPVRKVELSTGLVELYREDSDPANRGWALTVHTNALVKAERYAEACAAGAEAVELQREVVAADRDEGLDGLGRALVPQARALAAVGRLDEGLALGEEAIAVCRELVARDRAPHVHMLAAAVHGQAGRLRQVAGRNKARTRRARALDQESDKLWAEHQAQ